MVGSLDDYVNEHSIASAELPAAFAAYLTELSDGEWNGEVEEIRPANKTDDV
jgi:hypothetical protein